MDKSNENKKVTSIARKIHLSETADLFGNLLLIDVVICAIVTVGLIYCLDVQNLGAFEWDLKRRFITGPALSDLVFASGDPESSLYYTVLIGPWIRPMLTVLICIGVFELLMLLDKLCTGAKTVRKYLRPIHEMAQQTQQRLSEMSFEENSYQSQTGAYNETTYHNLEDAITHLKVDKPDAKITVPDRELQGIERAINDLLERMRNSYKQQTQFVSDASHELRTPIAVIQGYVNMLDRWGKEDTAILDESIEAIKNESVHMQKLVEQLLFLARGDSNRQKLDMKQISLGKMIKEVYDESVMIDEKHRYVLKLADEINTVNSMNAGGMHSGGMNYDDRNYGSSGSGISDIMIFGDYDMLKQSARILLDNAAKYTPEGEEIQLKTGLWTDGYPFFSIQDNGIGMNNTDVEHAFDRFYRADAVRNSKTGGTGLGLSIARWIVEQHGAYFDIVSREQIGTRFSVVFSENEQLLRHRPE